MRGAMGRRGQDGRGEDGEVGMGGVKTERSDWDR